MLVQANRAADMRTGLAVEGNTGLDLADFSHFGGGFLAKRPFWAEKDDSFATKECRFVAKLYSFTVKGDSFAANEYSFTASDDRFGATDDRFERKDDRFTTKLEGFAMKLEGFGIKDDRFAPNLSSSGANLSPFTALQTHPAGDTTSMPAPSTALAGHVYKSVRRGASAHLNTHSAHEPTDHQPKCDMCVAVSRQLTTAAASQTQLREARH